MCGCSEQAYHSSLSRRWVLLPASFPSAHHFLVSSSPCGPLSTFCTSGGSILTERARSGTFFSSQSLPGPCRLSLATPRFFLGSTKARILFTGAPCLHLQMFLRGTVPRRPRDRHEQLLRGVIDMVTTPRSVGWQKQSGIWLRFTQEDHLKAITRTGDRNVCV